MGPDSPGCTVLESPDLWCILAGTHSPIGHDISSIEPMGVETRTLPTEAQLLEEFSVTTIVLTSTVWNGEDVEVKDRPLSGSARMRTSTT